jgi:hypothetical protein
MATIESKTAVDNLIANNGEYADDPPVKYIVQYDTVEGKTVYAICYDEATLLGCLDSPYCRNQKMLFRRKTE